MEATIVMWGYGYGMGWMWLFGGLIVVGLAIIITLMVRRADHIPTRRGESDLPEPASTPQQLLDERYARGELTSEEYREHVETLRSLN